ncbi:MAG TPA: hypothetical protein VLJ60_06110, partial [bacterium]|nr:hypothetical protein [bacterium]
MKKILIVTVLICLCLVAFYIYAGILINRKIDETVAKAVSLLEKRTGLEMEISGTGFSFIPAQVYVESIRFSKHGDLLAAFSDCRVLDVKKLYFSKDRNVTINCAGSSVDGQKLLDTAKGYASSGKDTKTDVMGEKGTGYKLDLTVNEMAISFNEKSRSVVFGLKMDGASGRMTVKDHGNLKGNGLAEIIFNTSLEKIDVLMNSVPLDML